MLIARFKDIIQSDNELESQASCSKYEQAIQDAGVVSRDLRCRMHEGHLFIHGLVKNYRQKQLAQEAVRQLPGVLEITNLLQIADSAAMTAS